MELLRFHKPALFARYPLYSIALFGSAARQSADSNSDIDILVEVDPSIGLEFVTLADELEELLGYRVDLVSRNGIKADLFHRIKADLIYA